MMIHSDSFGFIVIIPITMYSAVNRKLRTIPVTSGKHKQNAKSKFPIQKTAAPFIFLLKRHIYRAAPLNFILTANINCIIKNRPKHLGFSKNPRVTSTIHPRRYLGDLIARFLVHAYTTLVQCD